ncbi:MAG: hypothetical protein HPM95_05770 [Alphaproteobacteria bacterium]|nr:hypothetical protein [Alphaproteobacteria bacterium]
MARDVWGTGRHAAAGDGIDNRRRWRQMLHAPVREPQVRARGARHDERIGISPRSRRPSLAPELILIAADDDPMVPASVLTRAALQCAAGKLHPFRDRRPSAA